jgi:Fic family protein
MEIFKKIDALKKEIDALRPISADLEAKIMQKFRLDWNYNSNAIEGNRLTFGETKTFLLHGITADGKPLKDHLDIKGHNNALLLLEDIIHEERPITESFIRELHQMILQEDYYNKAVTPTGEETRRLIKVGEYKQAPNHVKTATGEIFRFASPEETPAEMDKLIQWLRSEMEKGDDEALHPVAIASLFHYKFIRVHPFDDGNGRLARILMNMLLMRAGYPPSVIKADKKDTYYTALRKADGDDLNAFVEYVGTVLLDSMDLYLRGAKGESIEDLDDVDKEFELLRMIVEGQEENLILNNETAPEITRKKLLPLLQKILQKIFKCNDFYHTNLSQIELRDERIFLFETYLDLIAHIDNERTYLVQNKMSFILYFEWNNFRKLLNDLLKLDYTLELEVIFKTDYMELMQNVDPDPYSELELGSLSIAKFYYHKNPEPQATEVANKLLKDFMEHIKKNLEK